jgi:hypothetical protein
MKLTSALSLIGFAFSLNVYSQYTPAETINLAKSIKADSFFGHLAILSSDSLEGRATGSAGYNKAADYITWNVEKLGLQPSGANGSFYQPIAFETRQIEKASVLFRLDLGQDSLIGEYGTDITFLPGAKSAKVQASEQLVFAGFGLEIPELGINDFQGLDVRGKVVIITFGVPDNFDKKKYRKYLNPFEKIKLLEKKGVSGVIMFSKMNILQKVIFKSIHSFFKEPYFDYEESDISNPMLSFGAKLIVFSKKDFIEDIFKLNALNYKNTIKSMEKGQFKAIAIESGLEVQYSARIKDINCKNIVAMLPGSDPNLKSEYLVLSAHLDHLGIGKTIKKDSIYNGSWDNAAGSAALLAIAETFKQIPVAPERSILFLWVTGEEKGLLGSNYFAQKPTVPLHKIIADIDLDMPGGIFTAKDIIPMGYKMSNLSQAVDFAAGAMTFEKDTASSMESAYFENSDHFSFIKAGIPALFVFSGMSADDPKIDGKKTYKKWEKKIYHTPFDDMNQEFSREALLEGIQVNFLISWFIANEMDEVKWNTKSKQYIRYLGK